MPQAETRAPSSFFDEGRFPAGMVLAERYRIIGLLGHGGMGEVYRANDLKLGQPVALKFLPQTTARDPNLLARFHDEVRIARQVSHPNVCRVYDISEVDGATFLSMEYVDGEDLQSLLRRIGRLPGDKAIEIARKLCAGLAAAHDKAVLHRDLKPANIMIDGRGQVLITDFGLAALAGQLDPAHLRDGTPAYMAPEQLAGKEVSVRSDIYALGLVLHEMFTGKPAFEKGSQRTTPTAVSSLAKDIDPLVERVILRCLDVDPRNRPASALAVAAALPGGDPLAAALAAGDTPTPEMVAASGDSEGISVRTAALCLVWILAGLAVVAIVGANTNVLEKTPVPHSPEVLAQKAREMIQSFGYVARPADRAYQFRFDTDYQAYEEKQANPAAYREQLAKGEPPLIYFWYRQSPKPLMPTDPTGTVAPRGVVSPWDPPPTDSGMVGLNLDPQGRLLQLDVVPPQVEEYVSPPAPPLIGGDWKALFTAAGLDLSRFTSTAPQWISLAPFDARAAWIGSYATAPQIPIRIEAASWQGKPVFFRVVGPWSKPDRMKQSAGVRSTVNVVILPVIALGALLAWRNFRANRGDIRGANRAAAFIFAVEWLGLLLSAHHVEAADEVRVLVSAAVNALAQAAVIWALYLALEPYVRRRWPQSMISWSRVLSGGFRDPLVGGHLLFGVAAGIGLAFIHSGARLAAEHSGITSVQLLAAAYSATGNLLFLDTRGVAGGLLLELVTKFLAGLALTFLFMLLRVLLRREWLAATGLILLSSLAGLGGNTGSWIVGANAILFAALFAATLLRFGGLLPTIVCFFVGNDLTDPLIADFSAWYTSTTIFVLVVGLALTAYSFHTAVAGRPLFRAGFLEPD
jgi:serine/threonine-protein kinase